MISEIESDVTKTGRDAKRTGETTDGHRIPTLDSSPDIYKPVYSVKGANHTKVSARFYQNTRCSQHGKSNYPYNAIRYPKNVFGSSYLFTTGYDHKNCKM